VEIKIPRLVERKEDLPLLQRHFVERYSQLYNKKIQGITRRAQRIMARYHWPGNVRELENVISSACMITEDTVIDIQDLPEEMVADSGEERPAGMDSLAVVEHRHVLRVLKNFGGNKNRAAEVMGISRTTLYNILERIEAGAKEAAEKNGSEG